MQKFFLILLLSLNSFANNLQLFQSGSGRYWCPITGENLQENTKTNHVAKLINGTKRQYSSSFGLYFDIKEYGILEYSIQKYDITKQRFVSIKLRDFKYDENDFLKQKEWMENIKVKKLYKIGEKIFMQNCKNKHIKLDNFLEINELKGYLVNSKECGKLSENHLHSLSVYIWDIQKLKFIQNKNKIIIGENEKCPVCGMFIHKYPKWSARLHYGDKYYSFDGVKDLMKFYFNPEKWGKYERITKNKITKFEVTDYYTQNSINGFKAFYVIRSDVYGPMGNELIPFLKLKDAELFLKDHKGKAILKFDEITKLLAYSLDSNSY